MVGVAISEDFGGSGLDDLGRVVVMEELGASLCAIPFLTTGGQVVDIISKIAISLIGTLIGLGLAIAGFIFFVGDLPKNAVKPPNLFVGRDSRAFVDAWTLVRS